jgi:hypothetical protein
VNIFCSSRARPARPVRPQPGYEQQRYTTEAHKTSPAPTATILIEEKEPLNDRFLSVQSAVAICGWRTIKPSARVVMAVNTDRTMSPHIEVLPEVRAMRSILSYILGLGDGLTSAIETLISRPRPCRTSGSSEGWTRLSSTLLKRPSSQRDGLSGPYPTRRSRGRAPGAGVIPALAPPS